MLSSVDGRVLFQVFAGSYFGESVLTGRRRESTYVAATWCETFSLSKDDLAGLFEQHPLAGQRVQHAVLAEYERKEKLRRNALSFLINSMQVGPQRAALVLQRAWTAHTKAEAEAASLFPIKKKQSRLARAAVAPDSPARGGGSGGNGAAMAQLEEESAQQLRQLKAIGEGVADLASQVRALQRAREPAGGASAEPTTELHADVKQVLLLLQKVLPGGTKVLDA